MTLEVRLTSRRYSYLLRYSFISVPRTTSTDIIQAVVAVTTQGFFVYRIYVCVSRPLGPLRIYSQSLSCREEHLWATHMGKESIRRVNFGVA
jgi:hypothetical protein